MPTRLPLPGLTWPSVCCAVLCQERDARAAQRQSFIQQLQDEQAAAEAALEHLKGVRGTGRAVGVARVASSLHAHHRHCLPLVCRGGVYSLHAAAHPGGLNPAPYPPLPPPPPRKVAPWRPKSCLLPRPHLAGWHPGGCTCGRSSCVHGDDGHQSQRKRAAPAAARGGCHWEQLTAAAAAPAAAGWLAHLHC